MDIVTRVEKATGRKILEEANNAGKQFRNYLGNLLTGQSGIVKKMMSKADAVAENVMSQFLNSVVIIGCNVLGKLLKELRENKGKLEYVLPEEMHLFGKAIISNN